MVRRFGLLTLLIMSVCVDSVLLIYQGVRWVVTGKALDPDETLFHWTMDKMYDSQ